MTSTPPKDPGQSDEHNDEASRIHQERLTHPEIELRTMVWPNKDGLFFSARDTELDIVEIYPNGQMSQEKAVGAERFSNYCKARSLVSSLVLYHGRYSTNL